ncbi:MAG: lysophospholipid acyltransferase family protein [Deltaproteobacteria bacterium]
MEEVETAAGRVRDLVERRLPALAERLARTASETLGLLSPPREVPEVDGYGMSPEFFARWQPVVALALDRYFRLVTDGLEKIPLDGPALLVCNHSGVLPYDEILLASAIASRHPARRLVRPLTEDFAIHFPFAGSWLNRFGCVRACPENAERLLSEGHLVGVFPEGSHGIGKLYRNRYRLQRFGRGGFVRVALRAQVPIIPIAFLGAEEAHPVLARIDLPRSLGLPYLPITPTFPWLGPLGLWPLPSRLYLQIGDPIRLDRPARDAEDRPLVARLAEEVRAQVQEMLDTLLSKRQSVFR